MTFDEWREANYDTRWSERDYARAAWDAAVAECTNAPVRPACFEFAMEFLGGPEDAEVRSYVEALEAAPVFSRY